jgi:hypothetical protein
MLCCKVNLHKQYLALSPFNEEHYFLVYEGNKVRYALSAQFAHLVAPAINEYQASTRTVSAVHADVEGATASDPVRHVFGDQPPPYKKHDADHA